MEKRLLAKPKSKVKLPGGTIINRVVKKKRSLAHCNLCGNVLHGIRRNSVKSQKTVSRLHGGSICHNCLKRLLVKGVFSSIGR
ncbi:MAG: 50S ribosomal protein L34e [Candidatus Bathyarchaeia archaeon]